MDRGLRNQGHVHALTATGELLREHPGILPVLDAHGIVFCAGCFLALMDPLADVVGYHAVHDPDALLEDLEAVIAAEAGAHGGAVTWAQDSRRLAQLTAWEAEHRLLASVDAAFEAVGSGWVLLRAKPASGWGEQVRIPALVSAAALSTARTRREAQMIIRTLHYDHPYEESEDGGVGLAVSPVSSVPPSRQAADWHVRGSMETERDETVRILVEVRQGERIVARARVDLSPLMSATRATQITSPPATVR